MIDYKPENHSLLYNMKLLQEKLAKYDAPQRAMAMGIYPYFREIQSDQDTEVMISGKKVLMFGSNAYLGLTNHPKVKEAAIEAVSSDAWAEKATTGMIKYRFVLSGADGFITNVITDFLNTEE